MGLFDKIKGPVFLKESTTMDEQMAALHEAKKNAAPEMAKRIDRDIQNLNAGSYGESSIAFELKNSNFPMFILHDLYLEHEGLSAQIDFLIVTRRHIYVVECKNLYGNIDVDNSGNFTRVVRRNGRTSKEGMYSPITQNQRHLELIKQIRAKDKTNLLTQTIFEKAFYDTYIPLVVLANAKTVVNARYAKREVKEKILRADQITQYIRDFEASSKVSPMSEKEMEKLAHFFLAQHNPQAPDYTKKYLATDETSSGDIDKPSDAHVEQQILCPKCGSIMIKRTANKGPNAGKSFYGCSAFPKCRGILNVE